MCFPGRYLTPVANLTARESCIYAGKDHCRNQRAYIGIGRMTSGGVIRVDFLLKTSLLSYRVTEDSIIYSNYTHCFFSYIHANPLPSGCLILLLAPLTSACAVWIAAIAGPAAWGIATAPSADFTRE